MSNLKPLTIGIEEEYQIIDPESRELTSFISKFLNQGTLLFRDQMAPELLQSQVEISSKVCNNIQEARAEIIKLRGMISGFAEKNNRRILAAGTHPFSLWEDQIVTDKERYQGLVNTMQYVAKRLLIFGMHVHIGIEDRDLQIDIMNQMSYFMPHILTLSTSSPFWRGQNTGFKSFRSIIFEDLPRTGIPEQFSSAMEYDQYVRTLISCKSIEDPSKIWWDIRPHSMFPTLEFRICDCVTKLDDAMAIAALIQALVAKLIQFRQSNQTWRKYRRSLIVENKWRACKNGIDGSLIDFGKEKEIPFRTLMEEMLILIDDVVDPLGSRQEIEHIRTILNNGTSADRQITCYEKTGSFTAVLDQLCEETLEGC